MTKDDRLFAPFPIEMDEHPKIIGLSDAAFRAIFEATFYSRRMLSDGFLDERVVLHRWGQKVADELSSNDPERPSWVRVDHGWRIHDFEKHHPLRAEIDAKRADVRAKRAEAGAKGAANRWQKDGKPDSKPLASHSSETETETNKRSVQAALERDFAEWWEVYPRKQGKQAAHKKYMTVRKTVGQGPLLAGVRAYALSVLGKDRELVKMAQGWLSDGRWEDSYDSGPSVPMPPRDAAPSAHRHKWLADGTCIFCDERQANPF